jgi:WD40 repeat protein
MDATPEVPEAILAILKKPGINRSEEEKKKLQQHFDEGVKTLAKAEVAEAGVYAVALSPAGERVAAAGGDGTVRLFDTQTGSLVTSFVPVEVSGQNRGGEREKGRKGESIAISPSPPLPVSPSSQLPPGDAVVGLAVEPVSIDLDGPARYAQLIVIQSAL